MLTYRDERLLIDGKPVTLLSGEVHYFRLDPSQWADRLDRMRECGMNAVATYVPWLLHEYREGDIRVEAVEEFISLCEKRGFWVILRPGPFIMAEMKNEGIPDWVYTRCPGAVPENAASRTLDYMDPDYLRCVKRWYDAVLGMAARHTPRYGGRLVMVQLDNEIGMLEWVTHSPTLTPGLRRDFEAWFGGPYRAGMEAALSRFMRRRYADYVRTLMEYAREAGMRDVLYMVNIHGTGEGRGLTYPIGVSQLEAACAPEGIISGSDVYLDGFTMRDFTDMTLINGITACANAPGKPLCSMEFACGDTNYADDLMGRAPAYACDFTTRLFLCQGNRLLNHYLFCGGVNGRLPDPRGDGNDRFSFTGEYHGYAAPIGPDGTPNQNWPRYSRVLRQMAAIGDHLADCDLEADNVAFGYDPDLYMNEFRPDLEDGNRDGGCWNQTMRALLLLGVKPRTVHMKRPIPAQVHCLVLPSCRRMSEDVQRAALNHVTRGGTLLLHGRIPVEDETGRPLTLLADALGVRVTREYNGGRQYYDPAVRHVGPLAGFREFHASGWQTVEPGPEAEPLLELYEGGCVGFTKKLGSGRVAALLTEYKCYLSRYEILLDLLGVRRTLRLDTDTPGVGVYAANVKNPAGEEFLFLINMDDCDKALSVEANGKPWLPGAIRLPSLDALTLPRNVHFGFVRVLWSSAEILEVRDGSLVFRVTEPVSRFAFDRPPVNREFRLENGQYIVETDNRLLEGGVVISFGGGMEG